MAASKKVFGISSQVSKKDFVTKVESLKALGYSETMATVKACELAINKQITEVIKQGGAVAATSIDYDTREGGYDVSVFFTVAKPKVNHTQLPYNFDVFGL